MNKENSKLSRRGIGRQVTKQAGTSTRKLAMFLVSLLVVALGMSQAASVGQEEDGEDGSVFQLMPAPAKCEVKEGKFRLDENFFAIIRGPNKLVAEVERSTVTARAVERFLHRLSGRTGIFFKQGTFPVKGDWETAPLRICYTRPGQLVLGEDESYTLSAAAGGIELAAVSSTGILRGLETLLQLLDAETQGYFIPAVKIEDKPRFPWRGLLIDACRHFQPVEVIKRNLDGMAAVKLNVLHWHLSEDQGFRVECKSFPKLHQLGSDGYYYTQEQIREVIAYAADRGIRVMPEFDIPGHSTAWLVAYPDLAAAPGPYRIERRFGIFDPAFDPSKKATYSFFKKFFAEMCRLFPDAYMHIGGDENNGKQWDANPAVQAFMKKHNIPNNHMLQAYFNKKILAILEKNGKKMVGWDEIFQPGIPHDIVIHSWRGQEALRQAAQKGYYTILSNRYYIDLVMPTDYHYLNDPLPGDSPLSEEEKKYILGGEATMWGELISPETIDSRIWPRTAAIAERFWSPGGVNDVEDMYRRLEIISIQLEELGLLHIKNRDMLLRRLTRGANIEPLQEFLSAVEPLQGYDRHISREYTQFSPLTHCVDAAEPDAAAARKFRSLVERYVQEGMPAALEKEIRCYLSGWAGNHQCLLPLIAGAPVLKEIEPLSENLSKAAGLGLAALDMLVTGKTADIGWLKASRDLLSQAAKPYGQLECRILTAIEQLVGALQERSKQ